MMEKVFEERMQQQIDNDWERIKSAIKRKAKSYKFQENISDRYVEALQIWLDFQKDKKAGHWEGAFYCLHLYVECALTAGLHHAKERPKFAKFAREVQVTLETVLKEMETCMNGIRTQIEVKYAKSVTEIPQNIIKQEVPNSNNILKDGLQHIYDNEILQPDYMEEPPMTAEDIANAMDALRLDGKKTNAKLYSANIDGPSPAPKNISVKPVPIPSPPTQPAAPLEPHIAPAYAVEVPRKFRVKKVLGDGSCAFRSIAQGQHDGKLEGGEELRLANELRRIVCEELRKRADEEMTGTGLTLEQLVLMKDDKFPTFTEYVQAMSRFEYAGETEFLLLSKRLDISIAIFQPNGSQFEHIITYGSEDRDPVRLLWQRGMVETGNHYDALLLL